MRPKVIFKRSLNERSELQYEITGWKAINSKIHLPAKYLDTGPYFYVDTPPGEPFDSLFVMWKNRNAATEYERGVILTRDEWSELISTLHDAKTRLTGINKQINKMNKKWKGKDKVFSIEI